MVGTLKKITHQLITAALLFYLSFAHLYAAQPNPDASLNLTKSELDWLRENPIIKLGIDRAFPPFSSINSRDEFVGFTADILNIIEQRLDITFEINKETPWAQTLELAKRGEIDMIAGIVITQERTEYLHFTANYIKNPSIIVNRIDSDGYIGHLKNLENKVVAIENGSFSAAMITRDYPDINLLKVQNTELALELVSRGKADAYVGNAVTASYLSRQLGLNNLSFSGNTEYYNNHSIGIVKPNPMLTSIVEKALASITLSTRDQITNKWFGLWVIHHNQRQMVLALTALTAFFLMVAVIWIFMLKRSKKALLVREQQIRQQANFDSLTGLLNRRHFNNVLNEEMERTPPVPFALIVLNIRQFKEINDTLGHNIGDILLKRVSRRIKNTVRGSDIIARLGGDEFTIVIKRIENSEHIQRIVETVLNSLKSEFLIDGHSIHISSNVGVTLFPKDAQNRNEILANVDQAMAASKQLEPNTYTFFNESMREALKLKTAILRDLKDALKEQQFELFYQPIINFKTGEITKTEALIRWQHPQRGMISPMQFITLAEESGLIHEMGEWIFETATQQVAKWRQQYSPNLQVSINTSPLQYRDNGINVEKWQAQLQQLNLTGDALVLEITENLLMDTKSNIKRKLKQFSQSGLEIAIDDFGTGYSSLSYMKSFDIDYLKIDQSFVKNLSAESDDLALCEAIIVMAHKLECRVIAEGIENEQQCELLKKAGCDFGQGYLFSKPVPASEFEKILANNKQSLDPTCSKNKQIPLHI
ncbi:EAL domain-containing protein [Leucothrix sargassi]|nr:EAL domain-containing protein [Leucothrix sargassi]